MTAAPPRVLMVAPVAVAGGAGQVFTDLVLHAAAGGYEALPVLLRPGPVADRFVAAGIDYRLIDAGRMRNPLRVASTVAQLRRELRRNAADVIFATEPKAHLYCALAVYGTGAPALWRQPALPARDDLLLRAITMLPAHGVVVASKEVAARQSAMRRSPPVTVIPPGVDPARFRHLDATTVRIDAGVPMGAPLVGIVGRLQAWKGQALFLEAARMVLDAVPEAWFAIVGGATMGWEKGNYPDELRRLAGRLGIADRVVFTGQTDHADEWTAALDVAVNASNPEPFGLVVLEAMALGVTVVALDAGGPRDIISDSIDGLLVREHTAAAFAGQIVRALSDGGLRRQIGAAAHRKVCAHYSAARFAAEFGALISRTLAREPRPDVVAHAP